MMEIAQCHHLINLDFFPLIFHYKGYLKHEFQCIQCLLMKTGQHLALGFELIRFTHELKLFLIVMVLSDINQELTVVDSLLVSTAMEHYGGH